MKTLRSSAKKQSETKSIYTEPADIAAKIVSAVSGAISNTPNLTGKSNAGGGITVNIHVGDIYLIGFDEAIDAEEWGMRETNTEITGSGAGRKKVAGAVDSNELAESQKATTRKIDFSKGAVKLVATENSTPIEKKRQAWPAKKPRASSKAPTAIKKAVGQK